MSATETAEVAAEPKSTGRAKSRAKRAKGETAAQLMTRELREAQQVSILLKQSADATRFRVLRMLAQGEQNVGQICERIGSTQPAVSHHLALLRHGGLVNPRRSGKSNFYSLTDKGSILAETIEQMATAMNKMR